MAFQRNPIFQRSVRRGTEETRKSSGEGGWKEEQFWTRLLNICKEVEVAMISCEMKDADSLN